MPGHPGDCFSSSFKSRSSSHAPCNGPPGPQRWRVRGVSSRAVTINFRAKTIFFVGADACLGRAGMIGAAPPLVRGDASAELRHSGFGLDVADWVVIIICSHKYSSTLQNMGKRTSSIRIEATTLDRLDRLADVLDRSRTWLVNEAIERYLEHEEWFVRSVEAGIAAADRGDTVSHTEVMDRLRAKAEK